MIRDPRPESSCPPASTSPYDLVIKPGANMASQQISRSDLLSIESAGYRVGGSADEASVIVNEWFDRRDRDPNDLSDRQWQRCVAAARKGINSRITRS